MKTLLVLFTSVCLLAGVCWSEEAAKTSLGPSPLTVIPEEKASFDTTATTLVADTTVTTTADAAPPTSSVNAVTESSATTLAGGATSSTVASEAGLGFDDDDDAEGWVVVSAEELNRLMDEIEAEGRQKSARRNNVQEQVATPSQ
ncbi:hypothetical protein SprV_0200874900 [Sparganum proliferum]